MNSLARFLCCWLCFSGPALASDHAVILLYHNVSESTPASTSISPTQFQQHMAYLADNHYSVLPLGEILDAIHAGNPLPEKAVAISFDDAYLSIFDNAYPLLKRLNWPFSIFVSSDAQDLNYRGYMSWPQLAELQKNGAEMGGHAASHSHLVRHLEAESDSQWATRIGEEIDKGNRRLEEELGVKVHLFAYPYGEYNPQIKVMLSERNLYGLAQQSGAVGPLTELREIPRFPMLGRYADMDRFEMVAKTLPLPVTQVEVGAGIRIEGEFSGEFRMLVADSNQFRLNQLACYSSTGSALTTKIAQNWVSVTLPNFVPGRNKVNCTAPSVSEKGAYYWFSQQWLVKTRAGLWPPE